MPIHVTRKFYAMLYIFTDTAMVSLTFNCYLINNIITHLQFSMVHSKAIYIRLVDMKCPLVVVILIYTHLMQVCWIVTLWEVLRLITQPLIISIVTETCTSFDCIAIRIDHVSQPNIYSLDKNNVKKLIWIQSCAVFENTVAEKRIHIPWFLDLHFGLFSRNH